MQTTDNIFEFLTPSFLNLAYDLNDNPYTVCINDKSTFKSVKSPNELKKIPADDVLSDGKFSKAPNVQQYNIYNISGKLITVSNELESTLEKLSPGLYLLQYWQDGIYMESKKLVKLK